eukprot:4242047-Pleurochrysis_carterae.AAC.1
MRPRSSRTVESLSRTTPHGECAGSEPSASTAFSLTLANSPSSSTTGSARLFSESVALMSGGGGSAAAAVC